MDDERKRVLKDYNKLKKKYGLDDLEALENEFGFYIADKAIYLLIILKSITQKISYIRSFLYAQIEPNSYLLKYESKFTSDSEKEKILSLIKEMYLYEWKSLKALLQGDDERAEAIKEHINFFRNKVKPFALKMCDKYIDSWKKDLSSKKKKEKKHNTYIS